MVVILNKIELGREFFKTVKKIDTQIEVVRLEAAKMSIDPADLRDERGNWVLIPLLVARAQCLYALTMLNDQRN